MKGKKKGAKKRPALSVILDRQQAKPRPNKKTIYLTDEHAFKLSALAAVSTLNGRKYEQSSIVQEALGLWFAQADIPQEFTIKLASGQS